MTQDIEYAILTMEIASGEHDVFEQKADDCCAAHTNAVKRTRSRNKAFTKLAEKHFDVELHSRDCFEEQATRLCH